MDGSGDDISPMDSREASMRQESEGTLYYMSMLPLNSTILLRGVRAWKLMSNAMWVTKSIEFIWGVFTTTVSSKELDLFGKLKVLKVEKTSDLFFNKYNQLNLV